MRRSRLLLGMLVVASLLLGGCSDLSYYNQCVLGHLDLMAKRKDIAALIKDPETAEDLRQILQRVVLMRDFASQDRKSVV